jgi:hypothetical protein
MQGRFVLVAKALIVCGLAWLIVGCEPPRIKSMESIHAATNSNPPRDFKTAPLDPYSWGGIAMASGGRDSRTTYGALSQIGGDGVSEIYLPSVPGAAPVIPKNDIFNIPDPKSEKKDSQYVGSRYLDNDGGTEIDQPHILTVTPHRAALTPREKVAPKESSGE